MRLVRVQARLRQIELEAIVSKYDVVIKKLEPVKTASIRRVIENPQAFSLGFDGHNLATSFVGFDFAGGQALVLNGAGIRVKLFFGTE